MSRENAQNAPPGAYSLMRRVPIVSPESYRTNRETLNQLQRALDEAMANNEAGQQRYAQLQSELVSRIRAGEDARKELEHLQNLQSGLFLVPSAPSTGLVQPVPVGEPVINQQSAWIEELPSDTSYNQRNPPHQYIGTNSSMAATFSPKPMTNAPSFHRHMSANQGVPTQYPIPVSSTSSLSGALGNDYPPPAQQPPVQQPPTRPPVQRPPVQRPPVQRPPAQQPLVQRPPAQQPLVQQPSAQQSPVQQFPVHQSFALSGSTSGAMRSWEGHRNVHHSAPETPAPFSGQYSTAKAGAHVPHISQSQYGQAPSETRQSLQASVPHQGAQPTRGVVNGSGNQRPPDKRTARSSSMSSSSTSSPMAIDPPSTRIVLSEMNLPPSISKESSESVTLPRPKSPANPVQTNSTTSNLISIPRSSQTPASIPRLAPVTVPSQPHPLPISTDGGESSLFSRMPCPRSSAESLSTVQGIIALWFGRGPPDSWLVLRRPWDSYYKDPQKHVKIFPPSVPWPLSFHQSSNLYTIRQYPDGSMGLGTYVHAQASSQAVVDMNITPHERQKSQATRRKAVHPPQRSAPRSSSIASTITPQLTGARAPHHADTKSLAKDVLRALGYSPKRLKLEHPSSSTLRGSTENVTLRSNADSTLLAKVTSQENLEPLGFSKLRNVQTQPSATTLSEDGPLSQTIPIETLPPISELPDDSSAPSQYTEPLNSATQLQNTEHQPSPSLQEPQVSASPTLPPTQPQTPSSVIPHAEDLGFTNMPEPSEAFAVIQLPSQDQHHADSGTAVPSNQTHIVAGPTTLPATPPLPGEARMPLFYPSPSSSPSGSEVSPDSPPSKPRSLPVSESDTHGITNLQQRRHARIRKKVYILVPMLPYKVRSQRDPLTGVLASTPRRRGEQAGDGGLPRDDELAKARSDMLLKLALTRLYMRKCRWENCSAILGSGENLEKHVKTHVMNLADSDSYGCQWNACPLEHPSKEDLLRHLIRHARRILICPIQGCKVKHNSVKLLLSHYDAAHHERSLPLKSTPECFPPPLLTVLPPIPETMPAYKHESLNVHPAQIGLERHAHLGPWVLRNIFGLIDPGPTEHHAAVPLTSTRSSSNLNDLGDAQIQYHDEYAFLAYCSKRAKNPAAEARRVQLIRQLEDLNSPEVSQMVHVGTAFLSREDDMETDFGEIRNDGDIGSDDDDLFAPLPAVEPRSPSSDSLSESSKLTGRAKWMNSDEEGVVEMMLASQQAEDR